MAMEFIEKIRKRIGFKSRYKMAQAMGTSAQQYDSLINADDRIRLRDLIALRQICGLTDTQLLDEIEKKVRKAGFDHVPDVEAIKRGKPRGGARELAKKKSILSGRQ